MLYCTAHPQASAEILAVVGRHLDPSSLMERAGIDEFYVDATAAVVRKDG